MKILVMSDTHGFHENIRVPEDIDMMIHSGDGSNNREPEYNSVEMQRFLAWYNEQRVKYKIFVPGNHDTSYERGYFKRNPYETITFLEHAEITIDGIKIFGSPYTPTFGNGWAYNRDRAKINKYWEQIPLDTDILITHGPPKGVLDLSENRDGQLEYCGDKALLNHVIVVQPKFHIFGHIHDRGICVNHGTRTLGDVYTTFVNASMVEDGRFDKGLIHDPIIINY